MAEKVNENEMERSGVPEAESERVFVLDSVISGEMEADGKEMEGDSVGKSEKVKLGV